MTKMYIYKKNILESNLPFRMNTYELPLKLPIQSPVSPLRSCGSLSWAELTKRVRPGSSSTKDISVNGLCAKIHVKD